MPGIGTSGLMSGDWKRSWGPSQDRRQPRQSSTLPREPVGVVNAAIIGQTSGVCDPICWLPHEVRGPREW
jgi:hypothetical protein